MELSDYLLTLIAGLFLFFGPRDRAAIPLMLGACYICIDKTASIGPFHLTGMRILIAIGLVRVLVRGERIEGGRNLIDKLAVVWCVWAVFSQIFHDNFESGLVYRLGLVYNALGTYFLLRIFLSDLDDIVRLSKAAIIGLAPIALEMVYESTTGKNLFLAFNSIPALSEIRGDNIRAQGPFSHSILAGTVGAVCLPLAVLFWKSNRKLALLGIAATGTMVVTSHSSGPVATALVTLAGLGLWRFRNSMAVIRRTMAVGLIALYIGMNAPFYYLLAKIDLTGDSTGWHRAALIQGAIDHVGDWWIGGTDYTRDWTPNPGVDENHTDITNHYIRMGVCGGIPLLAVFIGMLAAGFSALGTALRQNPSPPLEQQFLIWSLSAILLGHVATMISISYFDQSIFFLYLILAAIGTVGQASAAEVISAESAGSSETYEGNFCHHR